MKKGVVTEIVVIDIKRQLQELALLDMDKFLKLTGVDIVQIFVCEEKKRGKSLRQISNKVKISRSAVANRCKKCGE